jgi:hypothetical protein
MSIIRLGQGHVQAIRHDERYRESASGESGRDGAHTKQWDTPVHPHETRRLFHPLPFDHHIRQRIEQLLGPPTGSLSQFPGT